MDTSAMYQAIQNRMLYDFTQSLTIGSKAKRLRDQFFRDAKNLLKGDTDDTSLTPLQRRMRQDINETGEALEALFDALDRQLPTEDVEDDPVSMATARLLGPLMGRIMSLEVRVAALEAALD